MGLRRSKGKGLGLLAEVGGQEMKVLGHCDLRDICLGPGPFSPSLAIPQPQFPVAQQKGIRL